MMPSGLFPQVVAAMSSGGLGLLFLTAGIAKWREPAPFVGTLAAYRLLPSVFLVPAARGLTGAELCLGLWLLSGVRPGLAGFAAAFLLGLFACAMGVNVARGRTDLSCGCLPGVERTRLSVRAVLRTMALAVLALLPVATGLPSSWPLHVQAVAGGACLFVLFLAFHRLADLPDTVPGQVS